MPLTSDSRVSSPKCAAFVLVYSKLPPQKTTLHSIVGWSIFYSCKKGAVIALLALYSNVLVMHLGTGPTAGHSAMVVVKKERVSCEAKSSVCFL